MKAGQVHLRNSAGEGLSKWNVLAGHFSFL
jgi:hypothetical protein